MMEYDEFLKHALPPLGYAWRPFRRRGVRRKVLEQMRTRHFCLLEDYLKYLLSSPEEQDSFKKLLPVTVSRFFRNRSYYDFLKDKIFPELIDCFFSAPSTSPTLRVWSLGASAGEEAYSIAIIWEQYFAAHFSDLHLQVEATDILPRIMERGKNALYQPSSLREVPPEIKSKYFIRKGTDYQLDPKIRERVRWLRHDLRYDPPLREYHLVFCAYSLFTYYSPELQSQFVSKIGGSLLPRGYFVMGKKEKLPAAGRNYFESRSDLLHVYRKKPLYKSGSTE